MKIPMIVISVLLAAVLGGLAYMGQFGTVTVEERDAGPYPFVYVQEASSDFSTIGQRTEVLGQRLEEAGFKQRKPAQIFYPAERGIQNQIGFVVDRAVPLDMLGPETFFRPIPAQRFIVARFPFRNSLSFRLGYSRVDQALEAYRGAKGYDETSIIVILEGDSLLYLQPVNG